ncbi:hypothetical protein FACS1894130_01220 [Spirochaetia bacterium]|nr:hypothetical protein FACS1894130_01220 [Spirochaetia bacterium]
MKQGLRKMMITVRAAICVALLAAALTALMVNCAGIKAETTGIGPKVGPLVRRYTPGTYEGTGRGFRGPVQVAVQVDANGIAEIEILKFEDDYLPGGVAMEELLELVLDAGTTDVDAVSGATESSAGFLSAVEDALSRAYQQTPKDSFL